MVSFYRYRVVVSATIFALLSGLRLYPYLLWSPEKLTRFGLLRDDAFFYSVIVRNFKTLGQVSFDGEMLTNGYQPLWMILQIFLAKIMPSANEVTLLARTSWFCYVGFAFFFLLLVSRLAPERKIQAMAAAALVVVVNPAFQYKAVQGQETPLMLLLLILFCWLLHRLSNSVKPSVGQVGWIMFVAGLVFLTRTDLFFIPLIFIVWIGWRFGFLSRYTVSSGLILLLIVGPYLIYNQIYFHSLMPISGRIKMYFLHLVATNLSEYFLSNQWLGWSIAFIDVFNLKVIVRSGAIAVILAILMIVSTGILVFKNWGNRKFPLVLRVLSLGVAGHLVVMQLVFQVLPSMMAYYFLPEVLWFVLLAVWFLAQWLQRKDSRRNIAFVVGMMVLFAASLSWLESSRKEETYWVERLNLVSDIARIIPENERLGAFWPGCFSQFSEFQIIPLDGLVGSPSFFYDYIKSGRELDYLEENNIRFVAVFLPSFPGIIFGSDDLPEISSWSHLGLWRLWEKRDSIIVRARRLVGENGSGWYLLELGCENSSLKLTPQA